MQQPPGWYPNPADASQLRWWDGTAWSSHTAPHPGWPGAVGRRRRIWPWIVGPVVGVLVLMGVCAAIVVPRIIGTFKHPIDAANLYLAELRDERLPNAYEELCVSLRAELPYDQYVARLQGEEQQGGRLVRFNVHQTHVQSGRSNEAIVDIDVTTTRGRDAIQARMVHESSHWRWCGSRPAPTSTGIFIHIP